MGSALEEKPFKNREDVKAEVKRCSMVCSIFQYLSFLFAILGIICGALDFAFILEATHWFLLAIFAGVSAIIPFMHVAVAKHLLGIEAENKKE